MHWTLIEAQGQTSRLVHPRILQQGKFPVLVKSTGYYTPFVSSCGIGCMDHPHVEVSLSETRQTRGTSVESWVSVVNITIIDAWRNGRARSLPVLIHQKVEPARTPEQIEALLVSLQDKIAEAVELCGRLDEVFDEAHAKLATLKQLAPLCTTRDGYESACAQAGIEMMSDNEIAKSYGLAFGHFTFPEYSALEVMRVELARSRKQFIAAPRQTEIHTQNCSDVAPATQGGQLWEPCERCGKEPVRLPLHLCRRCWPAQESA